MKTRVVDFRKEKCDIKVCRLPDNSIPDPPNPGCFGNPFYLINPDDDEERAIILEAYKKHFYERIEEDEPFREAVLDLYGKILGCFCHPKPCHADVIAEWLEENYHLYRGVV